MERAKAKDNLQRANKDKALKVLSQMAATKANLRDKLKA